MLEILALLISEIGDPVIFRGETNPKFEHELGFNFELELELGVGIGLEF